MKRRARCPLCRRFVTVVSGDPDTYSEHGVKFHPDNRCEASHWLVEDDEYLVAKAT